MDRASIEQHNVVSRYNRDQLDEQEREAFEIYLLDHVDMIEVVERDRETQAAYRANEALLRGTDAGAAPKKFLSWPRIAAAACVLLAFAVVLMMPPAATFPLQAPIVLESFRTPQPIAVLASGAPTIQFQVDVGPSAPSSSTTYTAVLMQGGDEAWREAGLQAGEDGWLQFALTGQRDTLVGEYNLVIESDTAPDPRVYLLEFSSP